MDAELISAAMPNYFMTTGHLHQMSLILKYLNKIALAKLNKNFTPVIYDGLPHYCSQQLTNNSSLTFSYRVTEVENFQISTPNVHDRTAVALR